MKVTNAYTQQIAQKSQRSPQTDLGKDQFLAILVAQLQNQDPLNGGDNTEYIAQMAQFSSLEQMQNLNTGFAMMLYYQNAQYASQLIGKNVTLTHGEEMICGEVEKTQISNGTVRIVIDGKPYFLEQITQIENIAVGSKEPSKEEHIPSEGK